MHFFFSDWYFQTDFQVSIRWWPSSVWDELQKKTAGTFGKYLTSQEAAR